MMYTEDKGRYIRVNVNVRSGWKLG